VPDPQPLPDRYDPASGRVRVTDGTVSIRSDPGATARWRCGTAARPSSDGAVATVGSAAAVFQACAASRRSTFASRIGRLHSAAASASSASAYHIHR
jgi:hypothetical protein